MLRRLERKSLLSSNNIQTESGRVRRVYTVTDKGEETLKKSLEYIINQKKIHDELADYYKDNFSS
jgi:DNA-binding PadR family transcriptional regulator